MLCFVRLCRRQVLIRNKRLNHLSAANSNENTSNDDKKRENKNFKALLEKYKDKITFSSYLEHDKIELGNFKYYKKTLKRNQINIKKEFVEKSLPPIPLALQYYVEKDRLLIDEKELDSHNEPETAFQLPFANATKPEIVDNVPQNETPKEDEFNRSNIDKWMVNYEYFDDTLLAQSENQEWTKNYGTPDPNASISSTQCSGCGALLHCNDPAIPGYLPSEIFKDRTPKELKTTECQRCHFLKEYNIALDVSVDPEEYERLLQCIKKVKKSLVILMVDLLDFPCSIWPGIVDIIGTKRPIIVVGNKVDLLPGDSYGYLKRIQESLVKEINKTKLAQADIRHISLISAKTGYGVEDLITAMFKIWMCRGDVYLVGCTNVGKSSLFNALIQSDYCKVHATDLINKATVSRWPGTTLNMLKFPINRISGWKIYQRAQRLKSEARLLQVEKKIRKEQVEGGIVKETPSLIGHIGRTFLDPTLVDERFIENPEKRVDFLTKGKDALFARSKWFYDTPGIIHPDSVLSLLTTEELLITLPKKMIRAQTYYLYKGTTLFIGGLARLDHLDSENPCRFTIFCSESLPITVTNTEDSDEVYENFVGTELFAAPSGGGERMKNWSGLKKHKEILEFSGEGPKWCCGDVVLSSVAWVSVTAKKGTTCKVQAWTPEGRGIHQRYPSLLPYSVNLKGTRLQGTPTYMIGNVFNEN